MSPWLYWSRRGSRWDVWVVFPGARRVARRARRLCPVVYARVWRGGPLVAARLQKREGGWDR
jgi:hypothetical protein